MNKLGLATLLEDTVEHRRHAAAASGKSDRGLTYYCTRFVYYVLFITLHAS